MNFSSLSSPRHLVRRRPVRTGRRAGMTLIEMTIVLAIFSTVLAIAVPSITTAVAKNNLRSAKSRLVSSLAGGRAAAIQKGSYVNVDVLNNRVTVHRAGSTSLLMPSAPLDSLYSVTVSVLPTSGAQVAFDARGMARGIASGGVMYVLVKSGVGSDTVCLSKYGMVRRTCDSL